MNIKHNLLALLPRFGLDEQEIIQRKSFLVWEEADSERINAQAERLVDFHSKFVDEMYQHLLQYPELQKILENETTLKRLKASQLDYYEGLLNGPYDDYYIAERLHVGVVHERIGLDMKWYLGAYRLYIERLSEEIMGPLPGVKVVNSFLKAVFLDISLAIEAYAVARREVLEISEARFARAMRGANDALWDWNLGQDVFYASARWFEMLDLPSNEIHTSSSDWFQRVHPSDIAHLRTAISVHINGKTDHLNCEYRMQKANGDFLWVQVRAVAEQDANLDWRLTGSQTDIHERKLLEATLEFDATHDPLTHLGNRSRLDKILAERFMPEYEQAHVVFVDLDQFKLINDSLGHSVGDVVLIETSKRLQASIGLGDDLIRFGGDEFVVISQGSPDALAERILTMLREPIEVGGHSLTISASLGIAPMQSMNPLYEPLQAADLALYQAKLAGKDQYAYYTDHLQSNARQQLHLEMELSKALDKNEFEIHYQPIYDISGEKPKIKSVEALLRWNSPKAQAGPQIFIPILEQSDNVVRVGEWVFNTVLTQVKTWHEAGYLIGCTINLSLRQLQKLDFADNLIALMERLNFPPDKLILEITEGQLMKEDLMLYNHFEKLAALGVRIALDDFGTGYCSFSYLKRFPLHILKLDKSFVQSEGSQWDIARAIIGLGHTLNILVVAEGVEHEHHLHLLQEEGCALVQGYWFSKPLPAKQLSTLLRNTPVA